MRREASQESNEQSKTNKNMTSNQGFSRERKKPRSDKARKNQNEKAKENERIQAEGNGSQDQT